MFRIAICDEERFFGEHIKKCVEQYLKSKEVAFEIDIYNSDKEYLEREKEIVKYKIIFIDTNMSELKSIITAQKIKKLCSDSFIVCVSAYNIFLFEDYRINSTKYIFKSSVNFNKNIYECLDIIFEKINCNNLKKNFKFVGLKEEKVVILDRLIYVESKLHELVFHIMNNKLEIYTMRGKLSELENNLAGCGFLRVHQSFLVNIKHIKEIKENRIILDINGDINSDIAIPKIRCKDVKNQFIAYKERVFCKHFFHKNAKCFCR